MPAVPFDTHAVVQELVHLGFPLPQAEGLSAVLVRAMANQDYATKADIAAVRADLTEARMGLELKIESLRGELHSEMKPLKWGMAVVVGGVISLVLKTFLRL
jgi:hypothetical protein